MKLVLEEWRHYLEGAAHLFMVYTYHKNLEYVRTPKRVNPCQAQWALFFFLPGFSSPYPMVLDLKPTTKVDALSRVHPEAPPCSEPGPILPVTCLVNEITWDFDQ